MLQVIEKILESLSRAQLKEIALVVKNHPLDHGRVSYARHIKKISKKYDETPGRIIFLNGGKLAPILSKAQGLICVNSTAGLQAGEYGVPVKVLGKALYDIPGVTTCVDLDSVLAEPRRSKARCT